LRFCLQDGATLVLIDDESVTSDSHRSASEDTLVLGGASPSTEFIDPRAAQTQQTPAAPPTAIAQQFHRRATREEEGEAVTPRKPTSPALIAAVTAIIALLLVLVGIGIALLMRGRSGRTRNADAETNRNAKNTNHAEDDSDNSDGTERRRPDMTGDFSPAAARVEAKILRGASVTQNDISGINRAELRRLRNTVYARHGRIFERMELQQYFDGRSWYKKRSDYTDDDLTPVDRDNINLIRAAEDKSP
jgi:hypothetical protein